MKKLIEVEFCVGNEVRIKPLEKITGRVISVSISCDGIEYEVAYFYNGEPKKVYLQSWQIEDVKERK